MLAAARLRAYRLDQGDPARETADSQAGFALRGPAATVRLGRRPGLLRGPHSYRECRARFGFNAASWSKAVKRKELRARARLIPIDQILRKAKSRCTVKRRLLEAGILSNRCDWCGLTEWRGRPISIQIDHVNGVRNDNRLENLRMLCPNCHSQTETFAARNMHRRPIPSSLAGRAPDSESGGPSFESRLGSHGPIV